MRVSTLLIDSIVLLANILIMLNIGIELRPSHFAPVARRGRMFAVLFVSQLVLLPLLGLLVSKSLSLPPPITAGILLVAACPVGDIANLYTLLGRGNLALSVSMNAGTCLLSTVTMTLIFSLYDQLLAEPFVFAVPPVSLVGRLLLMVVVPVVSGLLVRRHAPNWAERWSPFFRIASIVCAVIVVVYVLVTQQHLLKEEWGVTALAGGLFMMLAMLVGAAAARLTGAPAPDILTSGIFFSVRHVGLAMAIAVTLLHRVEYAAFAVVYFLTEVPLLLAIVAVSRRVQATDHEYAVEGKS